MLRPYSFSRSPPPFLSLPLFIRKHQQVGVVALSLSVCFLLTSIGSRPRAIRPPCEPKAKKRRNRKNTKEFKFDGEKRDIFQQNVTEGRSLIAIDISLDENKMRRKIKAGHRGRNFIINVVRHWDELVD